MVVVSHDQQIVRELCNRGIVIRRGKMVFDGEINDAIDMMNSPSY
jgi:ABC-2 type transport system ATP-binding protein